MKHHYYKNNKCKICKKSVTDDANLCKSCAHKGKKATLIARKNMSKSQIGLRAKEKHHLWIGGKPKCQDCGKQLTNYRAKYCVKHAAQHRKNYKGGYLRNKCLHCKKPIPATVKRCLKCYRKYILIPLNKITNRKNRIIKHHLYGKKIKSTILLTNSDHIKLHSNAYFYILKILGTKGIDKYINWCKKKFNIKPLEG